MSYYWISWVQPGNDVRPLHYPPGERVLGWWSTGYTQGGQTLCAMVRAADEQEAKDVVTKDWPEADEWRFCDPRETPEVTDRFPLKDWMAERFKTPNVRAKLPAEAGAVSLVRDGAPSAADQAYSACRSGSA